MQKTVKYNRQFTRINVDTQRTNASVDLLQACIDQDITNVQKFLLNEGGNPNIPFALISNSGITTKIKVWYASEWGLMVPKRQEIKEPFVCYSTVTAFSAAVTNFLLQRPENDDVSFKIIQLLLQHGAEPNSLSIYGNPLFHKVCESEKISVELIELFIKYKVDVNKKNNTGEKPLHILLKNSHATFEMYNLVCKETDTIDNTFLKTICSYSNKNTNLSIVEHLCNNLDNIQILDDKNWTPLHYTCKNSSIKLSEVMIQKNISLNAQNNHGETALHLACKNRDNIDNLLLIELLLMNGANPNIENNNLVTPTDLAFDKKSSKLKIMLLLSGGAFKNIFHGIIKTPEERAFGSLHNMMNKLGIEKTKQLLIEDFFMTNDQNKTVYHDYSKKSAEISLMFFNRLKIDKKNQKRIVDMAYLSPSLFKMANLLAETPADLFISWCEKTLRIQSNKGMKSDESKCPGYCSIF